MRSRYSAFILVREENLLRTWHESTRPGTLNLSGDAGTVNWLGLKIVRTEAGGPGDTRGVVEFVARYKVGGKAHRLHETSRFVREGGQWFYLDGTLHATTKSGRSDPLAGQVSPIYKLLKSCRVDLEAFVLH